MGCDRFVLHTQIFKKFKKRKINSYFLIASCIKNTRALSITSLFFFFFYIIFFSHGIKCLFAMIIRLLLINNCLIVNLQITLHYVLMNLNDLCVDLNRLNRSQQFQLLIKFKNIIVRIICLRCMSRVEIACVLFDRIIPYVK